MAGLQGVDHDGDAVLAGHAPVVDRSRHDAHEVVPGFGPPPVDEVADELPPFGERVVEVVGDVGLGQRSREEPGQLHRPTGEAVQGIGRDTEQPGDDLDRQGPRQGLHHVERHAGLLGFGQQGGCLAADVVGEGRQGGWRERGVDGAAQRSVLGAVGVDEAGLAEVVGDDLQALEDVVGESADVGHLGALAGEVAGVAEQLLHQVEPCDQPVVERGTPVDGCAPAKFGEHLVHVVLEVSGAESFLDLGCSLSLHRATVPVIPAESLPRTEPGAGVSVQRFRLRLSRIAGQGDDR